MFILSIEALKTIAMLCAVSTPHDRSSLSSISSYTDQIKCHDWYVKCVDQISENRKLPEWATILKSMNGSSTNNEEIYLNKCIRDRKEKDK